MITCPKESKFEIIFDLEKEKRIQKIENENKKIINEILNQEILEPKIDYWLLDNKII